MGIKVQDIMTKNVLTVNINQNLRRAACFMEGHNVGSLLVTRDAKVAGIVTRKDFLNGVCNGYDPNMNTIKRIMSTPIIKTYGYTPVEDAVKIMNKKGITRLPVVEGGKLRGIITFTDIARHLPEYKDLK